MTLDELLTQLMKIKEVYPDSGSFRIKFDNTGDSKWEYYLNKVIVNKNDNELVFKEE